MHALLLLAASSLFHPLAQHSIELTSELRFEESAAVLEELVEADPGDQSLHWALCWLYIRDPERDVETAMQEYLPLAELTADPDRVEWFALRYRWGAFAEHVIEEPSDDDARLANDLMWDTYRYAIGHPDDAFGWWLLSHTLNNSMYEVSHQGSIEALEHAIDIAPKDPLFRDRLLRQESSQTPLVLESRSILEDETYDDWASLAAFRLVAQLTSPTVSVESVQTVPADPLIDDDVRMFIGLIRLRSGDSDQQARGLEELVDFVREADEAGEPFTPAHYNAGVAAARYLVNNGEPEKALDVIHRVHINYRAIHQHILLYQGRARYLLGDLDGAFADLRVAGSAGAKDPAVYEFAADTLRKMNRVAEAAAMYEFYRIRVSECSSRAYVFCEKPKLATQLRAEVLSRGQVFRMFPEIVGPAVFRFLLELIAGAAAVLIAVTRPRRSRRYVGFGLLAAEIIFMLALVLIRLEAEATNAAPGAAELTWLVTITVRAFVLTTAGLYLSGIAGTRPKRARLHNRRTYAVFLVALFAAATLGIGWGYAVPGPEPNDVRRDYAHRLAFGSMSAAVRTGELGVGGTTAPERFAQGVRIVTDELTGRLVLPALFAYGLMLWPVTRKRKRRRVAAGAAAVLTASTVFAPWGVPLWLAHAAGMSALVTARMFWGLWACVLLHLVFVAGQIVGSAT